MRPKLDQVDTRRCTTTTIMLSPAFAAGVHDVRHGLPPRFDTFNAFDGDSLWAYERGRLWAFVAPVTMKVAVKGGMLNYKAVALFDLAWRRGYII
jgi:hypothetical protein